MSPGKYPENISMENVHYLFKLFRDHWNVITKCDLSVECAEVNDLSSNFNAIILPGLPLIFNFFYYPRQLKTWHLLTIFRGEIF